MEHFKKEGRKSMPPFVKALLWSFLNIIFGIAPLLILLLMGSISSDIADVSFLKGKINDWLIGCILMFFSCGLMCSAFVDYYLSDVMRKNREYVIGITVTPFFFLILVVAFYVNEISRHEDIFKINRIRYSEFEFIIALIAISYCLIVKTFMYSRE